MTDNNLPFIDTIIAYEQDDKNQAPPANAVLFTGSSTIRRWDTLEEDFAPISVINRGFGGSTVAQAVGYIPRIVWPYKPRQVIFYSGDNDLWRGDKDPQAVLLDYREFVKLTHQRLPHTRIALVSTKPSIARLERLPQIRALNTGMRQLSLEDERLTYIDVFNPMLGSDGKPREELFIHDGVHLSRAGYQLWTEVIRPHVG